MPTTIYSSSKLTERRRDKFIAQYVINRNQNGQLIVPPQTGYGAYNMSNVRNGAIADITRNSSGKEIIDPACICNNNNNNTINQNINPCLSGDIVLFFTTFDPDQSTQFSISGIGIITLCFNDGTPSLVFTNPTDEIISHIFIQPGSYTIGIFGSITVLASA
jgi:hypothetical protein